MVMDSGFTPYTDSINGLRFNDVSVPNENTLNVFKQDHLETNPLSDLPNFPHLPPDRIQKHNQNQNQNSKSVDPSSSSSVEEAYPEDCDFSDAVLKYISRMLLEEDKVEKSMFQESSELQAAEKPFYEILGQKYPHSPDQRPLDHMPDLYAAHEPAWHFKKGLEEAQKFLPNGSNLLLGLESSGLVPKEPKNEFIGVVVKDGYSTNGSSGRKNLHREDIDIEQGRSNKHMAVLSDDTIKSEMLDELLLCNLDISSDDRLSYTLQQVLKIDIKIKATKNRQQNEESNASNGGNSHGKKQGGKKDVVDWRTLLMHCAEAVAKNDCGSAEELLKQIRQHSSPFGDGNQRLAHYFANGLEARMVGTASQFHSALSTQRASTADILKAYQLYLTACPFKKISMFFSNRTIYQVAANTTKLHIVDFGILYGFQWPCFIQRLSRRKSPIKLRITGIDFPQPGFKPAVRVEETGRLLANYAKRFNVPFEYHAIAKKWEALQLEDLKIDPDETLAVNCVNRFRYLLDETVVLDSPRNVVLKLIRKMNPAVFVQGNVNGGHNTPFFLRRFREALFHFSSVFDMLEANVPHEHGDRLLLERNLFGREASNVIACEGSERIDRPETYKQWHARNMRAGFQQIPLQQEWVKKARDQLKLRYHKDFIIDQDGQWMLQGWKGRILFGISSWKAVYDS